MAEPKDLTPPEQVRVNVEVGHNFTAVDETVTAKKYSTINKLKGIMLDYGALGTVMTGSGPTVFGLFENEKQAQAASEELKNHVSYTCVTKTLV